MNNIRFLAVMVAMLLLAVAVWARKSQPVTGSPPAVSKPIASPPVAPPPPIAPKRQEEVRRLPAYGTTVPSAKLYDIRTSIDGKISSIGSLKNLSFQCRVLKRYLIQDRCFYLIQLDHPGYKRNYRLLEDKDIIFF